MPDLVGELPHTFVVLDARPGGEFTADINGVPVRGHYVEALFTFCHSEGRGLRYPKSGTQGSSKVSILG